MTFDPAAATAAYLATIPADVTARSAAYTEGGYWLLLWGFLLTVALTWLLVRWRILERVRERIGKEGARPLRAAFVVVVVFMLLSALLELPWAIYSQWWREVRYGLSNQPLVDWLMQHAISMAVSTLLGALFLLGIYALIRRMPRLWWLAGGVFSGVAVGVLLFIAPIFIEPLFNQYKPFPEGPTREAIVALARESGIPADRILVYDGSRQRDVVTANVSGVGGSARIAVSDVALDRANLAEVRAVVGHEIGHYVLGHAPRTSLFMGIMMLIAFYAAHRLFEPVSAWLRPHGIGGIADPAGIPILALIVSLFVLMSKPVFNTYSRIGEADADRYSLDHARDPDGLAAALIKTVEYRKASPGPVEEFIFHTHPSIENRVRMAMEWKAAHQAR